MQRVRAQSLPRIRFRQSRPAIDDHATAWLIAQAAANALRLLKGEGGQAPLEVEFAYDSLQGADVMQTVCRHVLVEDRTPPEPRDEIGQSPAATQQTPPVQGENEWYDIEKIFKRRKHSGRDEFLVQWKGTEDTSWVKRKDLTPSAFQQFYADRKRRRRHKRQ